MNFDGFVVRWACRDSGDGIRDLAQRRTRRGLRVPLRWRWRRPPLRFVYR